MAGSPTQRSLKHLRDMGYTAQVVERWNMHARRRIDLFGCIDIVAVIDPTTALGTAGVLGVQACAVSGQAARLKKSVAEPRLRVWLAAGNQFEVWGWAKRGPRGERKVWTLTRTPVTLDDLHATVTRGERDPHAMGDESDGRDPHSIG